MRINEPIYNRTIGVDVTPSKAMTLGCIKAVRIFSSLSPPDGE